MNKHYEEMINEIKLTHDMDTLQELKHYNFKMQRLFFSLIIHDTKKSIFECCREYLNYMEHLDHILEMQIEDTFEDMAYSQPADEED